jgi:DNA-directed RNA polymerase subunit RPC12/RpoP
MGEITDMILVGILCFECGTLVEPEEVGFPRRCEECEESEN